jgi:hypothetical protein
MRGTVPTRVSWTFLYLMIGLKIPIAALLYLVWWAIRQVPETEPGAGGEGHRKPRHPRPPLPRRPRRPRGAHGLPVPAPPQRMRVVTARSLATARAKRHRVTR